MSYDSNKGQVVNDIEALFHYQDCKMTGCKLRAGYLREEGLTPSYPWLQTTHNQVLHPEASSSTTLDKQTKNKTANMASENTADTAVTSSGSENAMGQGFLARQASPPAQAMAQMSRPSPGRGDEDPDVEKEEKEHRASPTLAKEDIGIIDDDGTCTDANLPPSVVATLPPFAVLNATMDWLFNFVRGAGMEQNQQQNVPRNQN
ncbi:hypothetical protein CONLIGDRAFT_683431 [Coniochaeta ligniaria NRRL 30616]|uniref:Uncharacterized protein n=1 Tax=Coniochaeta ligniaria NRRL 30616 TaxID=1408157 RepID=A0A1J7JFS2_9PEZI|nr:hypothetical protein CONLIGDRAFT_683431 [Coniochaeta ligniaria NRRL 30616]